jgi:Rhodopirellula transposase DDE domain
MAVAVDAEESLRAKFAVLLPHLDERQQRLCLGAEARSLGHGGVAAVARAAGVSRPTVTAGVMELEAGQEPLGRVRRAGGGRKRAVEVDRGLRPALLALAEPDVRGDPGSPLRWTTRSTRKLAAELTRRGHPCGPDTVAGLLRAEGFSLQGNAKTLEGAQHPDRDGQFRYINEQARAHLAAGDAVASVDTRKKELVGRYRNGGREWQREGAPVPVKTRDFPDEQLGKAIPYGIYDVAGNTGWVSVGTDHDTAAFAVASLRRWWQAQGRDACPQARRLLVTADAGGSNSYRTRAWKTELAALAAETGLEITVCHFPPGTSKWNAIEHRLFAHISMNWRGRPLTSHEVIVNTIAATTTRAGLRVHAELDDGAYPTGTQISDAQMAALAITRHYWHGDWNYTLHPAPAAPPAAAAGPAPATPAPRNLSRLAHPFITGMPTTEWDNLLTRLAAPHHAQREARLATERGSTRRNAPGSGGHARLTLPDRLLATILNQRYALPKQAIAQLFGVSRPNISKAVTETRMLLDLLRHPIRPAGTRLATLADLASHAAAAGIDITTEIKLAC